MPYPDTFLHFIATCSAGLAALFIIFSLLSDERDHCLRVAGLCLICCFALFSDSSWTYGISIFLTATAITELKFIERLAAIIFRTKEYWTPERSPAPPKGDEVPSPAVVGKGMVDGVGGNRDPTHAENVVSPSIDKSELNAGSAVPDEQTSAMEYSVMSRSPLIKQFGGLPRVYEILSIDKFSKTTGRSFENNVEIKLKSGPIVLDAFSEGKAGLPDILVEVKTLLHQNEQDLIWGAHKALMAMNAYRDETKRTIVGAFIVVIQSQKDLSVVTRQRLENLVLAQKFTVQLKIHQFSELFVR